PKPIEREELLSICKHSLSSEKNHHIQQKKLRLGTVGLYIKNQIASYCLHSILDQYSLEYEHFLSRDDLLVSLSAQKYSLIILDIGTDIDFAYHIRTQYPKQLILMITNREQLENSSLFKYEHIIHYPFDNKDVYSELESISSVYHVQKKADEAVAFAGTISNVSDSIKIQDCIYKSDNQLAIWQKSFGSIGGDLVLSKQFNKHGRFGFILADVTGHDAKSSYVASWFSGLVQGIWAEYSEPIELLKKLNELYAHEQDEEDKRYVCALVLLWDRIRSTLYWANSGIPEGLLVSKSINHEISSEWVSWRGAPIGMFQENLFDYGQIELLEGDRLILATDGILEAVPESLFQRLGKQHRDSSAQEALNSIVDFLDRTVETFDDLTLVVFDNNPLPIASNQIRFSMPSIITEIDTTMTLIFDCLVERSNGKLDANLVIMAIREGLLNAVEHGNKGDESRLVDIDLDFHEKEVRVVISDCGAGFSLNRVKEKHADAGILRVQGRGIEMIESFSNKVEFFAGSITMHFLYSE
ncbi:MAG: anti-sigma regulatory factor (Ser/Thr protein kinase), partial [bacterium]